MCDFQFIRISCLAGGVTKAGTSFSDSECHSELETQSSGSVFSPLTSEIMLAQCPRIHASFNPGSCIVSKLSQHSMRAWLDCIRDLLSLILSCSDFRNDPGYKFKFYAALIRTAHIAIRTFSYPVRSGENLHLGGSEQVRHIRQNLKVFEVVRFCTICGGTKDKSDYVGETGSVDPRQNRASCLIHGYQRSVDKSAQLI